MDFEQDYIMRMIKQMIRALAVVIFGKKFQEDEIEEAWTTEGGMNEKELMKMADAGRINEAENILLESLDTSRKSDLRAALIFYDHINDFSDDFLEEHNYSREEIKDGIKSVVEDFGMMDAVGAMLE
ncbi:DUF6483 family protein [Murimonas intestini]|uniref:Uncharacterized protein n=1 Tax=Murimonas intestini TaxID=1337051 RepID=A0AB73T1G2_9FIRM|nr:DUF6483 family protein [Murimonas intestini]MCR1842467.1 DUF6483 family protein [Murimonas intestini]MCR1867175.1 DUF6483 family protein [Murimonas intestini]MCR1884361.1 DUF6483 family protein [Murimonas intestini]